MPALSTRERRLGGDRQRVEQRSEREAVDLQPGAREVAQRVVGAARREVVEPTDEVGRVRPQERDLLRHALERLDRRRERAGAVLAVAIGDLVGDPVERGLAAQELDEVVVGARAPDRLRHVADRRARVAGERAQLAEQRDELVVHDGLGVVDERVEVVQRGAQVDERRVGLAHDVRQQADRLPERLAVGGQRGGRRREVAGQVGEHVVARRDVGHEARRLHDEALEVGGVAVELGEQLRRRGQRRVEVAQGGVGLVLVAGLEVAQEGDGLLDALARLRVERVEDLVEVDGGRGVLGRQGPAVGDVGAVGAAELQVDVAVGDAGERGLADDRARPAAQRVIAVGVDVQRDPRLAVGGQD